MAETTKGRVIFTAGKELDRYIIWDDIKRPGHFQPEDASNSLANCRLTVAPAPEPNSVRPPAAAPTPAPCGS